MEVQVGQVLKFRNRHCLVTLIENVEATMIAMYDSEAQEIEAKRLDNVYYLNKKVEPYKRGDIITITGKRVCLEVPGETLFFIEQDFNIKNVGRSLGKEQH